MLETRLLGAVSNRAYGVCLYLSYQHLERRFVG